jgi:hypothetical protein
MNEIEGKPKLLWLSRVFKVIFAIVSMVAAILGIYSGFFYEKKPEISYEVLSNATVLAVREKVSKD